MISRFERFSFLIARTYRNLKRIESSTMEKYGLKGTSAIYLATLCRYPEGLTSAKLSEMCGRNKAEVSRELTVLANRGLVAKPEGKRSYRASITLTERGRRAAEKVASIADAAVNMVSGEIGAEDIDTLYATLERIADKLEAIDDVGIPEE